MTTVPAAERPSRSRLVLLLAATGWLGWCTFAPVRYTYGDSCLSHARGAVQLAPSAMPPRVPFFDGGNGIPDFVVPFPDPRATIGVPHGQTGLRVSYIKRPDSYGAMRAHGPRANYLGCPRTPVEHGLSRIEVVETDACTASSYVTPRTYYEPTELPDGFADVFLRCNDEAAVRACRFEAVMANDWELSMALPKPLVPEWPATLTAARNFFDDHLADCGP